MSNNDREKVVEIVSGTAGKLSESFHLLCLPQLVFEGTSRGHVFHDDLDQVATLTPEPSATGAQRNWLTVTSFPRKLDVAEEVSPRRLRPKSRGLSFQIKIARQIEGQQLAFGLIDEHFHQCRIGAQETVLFHADASDAIGCVFYERTKLRLGASQLDLRLFARTEVGANRGDIRFTFELDAERVPVIRSHAAAGIQHVYF